MPFKYALPDLRSSVLPPISESVFSPDQMTLDASPNLFSQDGHVSQEPIIRTDLPAQSQDPQQMLLEGTQPGTAPPEFTLEGADSRQLASFLDTMTATDVGTTPVVNQDSGFVASYQGTQRSETQPSATQPKKISKPKKSSKPSTVEPRVHPQRDNRGPPTYLNKVVTHKVDESGEQAIGQAGELQSSGTANIIPKPPVVPGRPFARLYPTTPNFKRADPSFTRQLSMSLEQSRAGQKKVKKQKYKKSKKRAVFA